MSKPFLKLVAEDFYRNQLTNHPNPVLIFPNKRMIAYFRKYLAETIGKSQFSPLIYTIEAFVKDNIKLTVPDKLSLIFRLYDAYKEVLKDYAQPLDKFYSFAETLLADFNELDSYLINPNSLFTNISDLAATSDTFDYLNDEQIKVLQQFWTYFEKEKLNSDKEKFLKLWKAIPEIYKIFTQKLLDEKLAYSGLQLKKLYENFKVEITLKKHHFIVGFNALNEAHLRIFELMGKENIAHIYWDTDDYYLNDKMQEAGLFLRKNITRLKKFSINFDNNNNIAQNIHKWETIGVPGRIAQTQFAAQQIINTPKEKSVGIILPDENLLFPVLHSLPEKTESFNITMGYPFSSTNIHNLIHTYLKLHQYRIEFSDKNQIFFPLKYLRELVHNPLIKSLLKGINDELNIFLDQTNLIRINRNSLNPEKHPILNNLFTQTTEGKELIVHLHAILYSLFLFQKNNDDEKNSIESEFIIKSYNELMRLKELIDRPDINILLTIKLCFQALANLSIPFSGEKLEQLQIMGLMETRSIDFDYVIIVDANEGILPNISKSTSFIPQIIRKAFELPITAYQDAIFAYLFYRLLQRSEKVYIVYNDIAGGNSTGEKSRYISQLEHELDFSNKKQLKLEIKPKKNIDNIIRRTPEINNKLQQYLSKKSKPRKKITATFLSNYQKCSLSFYFKYIAELKAPDTEDIEELSHKNLGIILHNVLATSYNNLKENNKIYIDKNSLKTLTQNLENITQNEILKTYKVSDFESLSGGQKLNESIVNTYAKEVFKYDISKHEKLEIIGLEEQYKYSHNFPIEINSNVFFVEISGTIDRVDKTNQIRIIDYKTGNAEKRFKNINDLFQREDIKYSAIFQVLLYSYIYYKKNAQMPMSAIYDLRQIKMNNFNPAIFKDKEEYSPDKFILDLDEFENNLKMLLENIFYSQETFYQAENKDVCTFCDYKTICKR